MSAVVIVGSWDSLFQDTNTGGSKGSKTKSSSTSLPIPKANSRGTSRNKSDSSHSRSALNGSDELSPWIVTAPEKPPKVEKKISIITDIQGAVDFILPLLLFFFVYKCDLKTGLDQKWDLITRYSSADLSLYLKMTVISFFFFTKKQKYFYILHEQILILVQCICLL